MKTRSREACDTCFDAPGRRNTSGRLVIAVLAGLLLFCLLVPPSARSQAAIKVSQPFETGEKLAYDIDWNPPWYLFFLPPMDAGEAQITLSDAPDFSGGKAVKIDFTARSSGTFARLAGMKVDDHFEYITHPDTFCTYRALKQEREGRRKRDIEVIYSPQERKLHIRELDQAVSPPLIRRNEDRTGIPECVQDLFSAVYFFRRKEFSVGAVYRATVGDNDKVKEVEARIEKLE